MTNVIMQCILSRRAPKYYDPPAVSLSAEFWKQATPTGGDVLKFA
jgi:hypothetical protein